MRIFFALDLPPSVKQDIADWRDRSFRGLLAGATARAVPAGNFHVTLAFVGEVPQYDLDRLCCSVDQLLDRASIGTDNLAFDELGYWQRQGILWLGPKHYPHAVVQLADRLKGLATRVGGKRDNKAFQPHITLFRRCEMPPPPSLEPPEFKLEFEEFTLFESKQGKRGVDYYPLQHWSLANRFNG